MQAEPKRTSLGIGDRGESLRRGHVHDWIRLPFEGVEEDGGRVANDANHFARLLLVNEQLSSDGLASGREQLASRELVDDDDPR